MMARRCWRGAWLGVAMLTWSGTVSAQLSETEVMELRRELQALRDEQARRAAELAATNARIEAIDAKLGGQGTPAPALPSTPAMPSFGPPTAAYASKAPERLDVSGDIRLRYESNSGETGVRDRRRAVLRARLRAAWEVNDWLKVGGQITTGDADDPNSTDVTLSNFDDDLNVSLDQAYVQAHFGGLTLTGGKFANPFERTDLVWDGDVSPQGVAATYQADLGGGVSMKAAGLYFVIDEQAAGPDADMIGGQLLLGADLGRSVRLSVAAAYYDYHLRSIAGADAGDFRSNLIGPGGRYLSDFDLIDGIAVLRYTGFGERWPLLVTAEYVRNLGAATGADSGYVASLALGRAGKVRDWRVGYQYMVAETDAVFAAFSHDNLGLATNYVQHGLTVDYMLRDHVLLNTTLYHYRPKTGSHDWRDRVRLNLQVDF